MYVVRFSFYPKTCINTYVWRFSLTTDIDKNGWPWPTFFSWWTSFLTSTYSSMIFVLLIWVLLYHFSRFFVCFVFGFCFCPGTCHDEVNNFRCDCPAGYLGRTCDNATNECSTNPCKNGGTCWDLHLDYVVRICSQRGGKVEVCFNSCNKFKTKYLKSYIVTCIP